MLLFKPTVRIKIYSPTIHHILTVLFNYNERNIPIFPPDWTITSINDSTHMTHSKHYADAAIDLRSKNFNKNIKELFRDNLHQLLGINYTILYEAPNSLNEHFHIQLRKGLVE
jgi:hypothetical protein